MTGQLRTSRAGLDLIRSFEGFRETSVRLPDGRWTIGHGHVRTAREGIRIDEADALDLLKHDLVGIEESVTSLVHAPLNQNQFDALVSFTFNISPEGFRGSEVLAALNAGDEIGAAAGFDEWRHARVNGRVTVIDALVRRRAAEKALFLEPTGSWPTAPTPIVTPVRQGAHDTVANRPTPEPQGFDPLPGEEAEPVDFHSSAEHAAPDIARAVADLAGRLGPSELRRSPLQAQQTIVAPSGDDDEDRKVTPSQAAAQRLSRILSRVDEQQPATTSATNGMRQPSPESIPMDLPDLSAPNGRGAGKPFIDDTEVVAPHGAPQEVFSAALEEERRLRNGGRNAAIPGNRALALAPWFSISTLCSLGLGVAVVESAAADSADTLMGGAAPTMIAVFGLLLAISGYYILRRLADED